MRSSINLCVLYFLVACGPENNDSATTGSGSTSTTGDATSSDSTSTATSGATSGEATSTGTSTDVTTTGTSSTTTAATTGEPVPEACSCGNGGDCGPVLCDEVAFTCTEFCGDPLAGMVSDEAALQCALEALRDRTPGKIAWSMVDGLIGNFGDYVTLWILADGTAVRRPSSQQDLDCSTGPDSYDTLKDPAYFEGCLAQPDPLARFDCMRDAVAGSLAQCAPYDGSCGGI